MREADVRVLLRGWMVPLLLLAAGNVVVAGLWTWPAWSSRAGFGGRDDALARASELIEPRLERARATYGRVAEAGDELARLRRRMLAPGSAAPVRAVQAAATDAGLAVEQTRFQPAALEELGLVELGMTVPVRGSYAAVRRLVEGLDATSEFLVIRGVTLAAADAPGSGAGGQGLRVDLTMSAFLAQEGAAGSPGARAGAERARRSGAPAFLRSPPGPRGTGETAPRGSRTGETAPRRSRTGETTGPTGSAAEIDPVERARELVDRLDRLPPLPLGPGAFRVAARRPERPASPPPEPGRNLFAYDTPAPEPAAGAPPEPEPEPDLVEEPPPPVRLVGIVTVDGRRQASLTDGTDIFVGGVGTLLPNGYRIVDIGNEHVDVDAGERRIHLVLEDPGS